MITVATCCHVIGGVVSAAMRFSWRGAGLGVQGLCLEHAHEVVEVVTGEVGRKVATGLRKRRVSATTGSLPNARLSDTGRPQPS